MLGVPAVAVVLVAPKILPSKLVAARFPMPPGVVSNCVVKSFTVWELSVEVARLTSVCARAVAVELSMPEVMLPNAWANVEANATCAALFVAVVGLVTATA